MISGYFLRQDILGKISEMWRIFLEILPPPAYSVPTGQHLSRAVGAFQVLGCKSYMDYLSSIGNISLRWLLLSAPLLQKEAGLEPFTSLSRVQGYKRRCQEASFILGYSLVFH